AWTEKYENTFQMADFSIIAGSYSDQNDADKAELYKHINFMEGDTIKTYNGEIDIVSGKLISGDVTVLNARSVAEDVIFSKNDQPYSGKLAVSDGKLNDTDVSVSGKSLLHSAALTSRAFTKSFLGENGKYIVAISLALFAFSTAVAWSYYGDRAITFLVGTRGILPYRVVYVIGFFIASFADTTVIWTFAAITVAFMTIPNVICMFLMRKEVKHMVEDYAKKIK
ncbi:MAG TPA: alanine:cation symporter family protein, partial [Emcibacteraceae bacterium]|nr:alanine:cation symporter family protein [Emcibacteraceae bacterium]